MKIDYRTINLTLPADTSQTEADLKVPAGLVCAIGTITEGNTNGEIIDLSIAENGNDVLRPCDVRFSEPKSAGRWIDALRPTTIDGGRTLTFKLNAYTANRPNAVKVQVLIAISC